MSSFPSGIEVEEGESTFSITQEDILKESDVQTNQKAFGLTLDKLGPYNVNYTRNGRILILGGRKGHIATLDWQRKKLKTEFNVSEQINAVTYEHPLGTFLLLQLTRHFLLCYCFYRMLLFRIFSFLDLLNVVLKNTLN